MVSDAVVEQAISALEATMEDHAAEGIRVISAFESVHYEYDVVRKTFFEYCKLLLGFFLSERINTDPGRSIQFWKEVRQDPKFYVIVLRL